MSGKHWSFWRDEAKLSILDPEARVKVLLGFLAGLVVAGLSGFIGSSAGLNGLQSSLISIFVGLILLPASLAIEMFYKGKKAGKSLKEERDALRSPSQVPVTVAHVRNAFHNFIKRGRSDEIKQNVSASRAWAEEVQAYAQTALIDERGDCIANIIRNVRSQPNQPPSGEAIALSRECVKWLEHWQNRVTADSLRPGFMVPSANATVAAKVTCT